MTNEELAKEVGSLRYQVAYLQQKLATASVMVQHGLQPDPEGHEEPSGMCRHERALHMLKGFLGCI